MYTFTSYGRELTDEPTTVAAYAEESLTASDVRHLPLWIAAARAADEADHCGEYDQIARAVGGPSRDDLRDAGFLDSTFTVEGTREVTLTVRIPFTSEYTAARPGDVRRNFDSDELGEVDMYDVREAINNFAYTVDSDDIEIDDVTRN
jgi:hypothetical protein